MPHNHILFLIDDDADDHEIFKSALDHVNKSTRLLAARNGQDALQTLAALEQLPDFIFLDLNMPRMGGIQFLAEIKKSTRLQPIPVFVYSTSNHPHDKDNALEAGATRFITKPAKFSELCELLKELLSNNS